MPWTTPTLRQVREMTRDDITSSLQGAAVVGNTVLRVMSDAMAGLANLVLRYISWLALQLMPDSAEKEWLDRHGQIWLVNADGSLGRKGATQASGTVGFTGLPGIIIPEGSVLISPTGQSYETLEFGTLPDTGAQPLEIAVKSINPGADQNQPNGTALAQSVPISGVDGDVLVIDLRGGTDVETDEALRARVLARIRQPPMGGCGYDYEAWALSIPSVSRAWCAPRELGMGTVTLRFMADYLRSDTGGFPTQEDINIVETYLDKKRPVAVRDFFIQAPVAEPINFGLSLVNDSLTARNQVAIAVSAMLLQRAMPAHQVNGELVPGTTVYASWVAEAINRVTNEFELDMQDHPMPHNGALATLGTITYPTP
jgi:uncharacterized phage protein gp47/JayE